MDLEAMKAKKGQSIRVLNTITQQITEGTVHAVTADGKVASIETPTGDIVEILNKSFKIITLLQAIIQLFINFFKK